MLINDTGAHRVIKSNDDNISTSKEADIANSLHCCISKNCSSCSSFVDLLHNFTSDGTIYVTMNMVLPSVVQLTHLKNIAIVGYNNPIVHCGYSGGLQFVHCHNLTIEGIKWNGCGTKSNASTNPGIGLYVHNSSNIIFQNCTFQNSFGQSVVLSEVLGNVNINNCKFKHNNYYNNHGTAIHYSSNNNAQLVFMINNCTFDYNKGASIMYVYQLGISQKYLILQYSNFKNNEGVPIYILKQKLFINGLVVFEGNKATDGGGLFVSDYASVIFNESSVVTFSQNVAGNRGGAIFTGHDSVTLFEQASIVQFINNTATTGGAVFSKSDSKIIIRGNSDVTCNSNSAVHGGALACLDKNIFFILQISSVTFIDNNAEAGGAIYLMSDINIIFDDNTVVTFTNNSATIAGGAVLSSHNVDIVSKGNSSVMFRNNFSKKISGAVSCNRNSSLTSKETSTIYFSNNRANVGGAAVFYETCTCKMDGNSVVTFYNNTAIDGGAIMFHDHSNFILKGSTSMTFVNNIATHLGGL